MARRKYGKDFIEYRKKYIQDNKKGKVKANRHWRFRWKKLVKYDYDWDWIFFIEMIVYKLELMLDYFNNSAVQDDESRLEIVNTLKEVCDLGNNIIDDKFDQNATEFHHVHCAVIDVPDTKHGYRHLEIVWDSPENEAKYHELMKKADKVRQKNIDKFFKLIRDNFTLWWD